MEMATQRELAKQNINGWLDALFSEAEKVVEAHWALIRDGEQKRPGWENRSCLRIRARRTGNTIKLEWEKVRWVGSKAKGTRKALVEYIRKGGRGYGYNLKTLTKLCKEWEKPLVEDTEKRLTEIRREWRHANEALRMIRMVEVKSDDGATANEAGGAKQ